MERRILLAYRSHILLFTVSGVTQEVSSAEVAAAPVAAEGQPVARLVAFGAVVAVVATSCENKPQYMQ